MTNQQYIKKIVKVAVKGEYDIGIIAGMEKSQVSDNLLEYRGIQARMFLDPNFFTAIGKVKRWGETNVTLKLNEQVIKSVGRNPFFRKQQKVSYIRKTPNRWKKEMHTFLDKIIEKDLDHAIEWLYKLIKE